MSKKKTPNRSQQKVRTRITFELTDDLKADLQELANQDERPIGWYIRNTLRRHVAALKQTAS